VVILPPQIIIIIIMIITTTTTITTTKIIKSTGGGPEWSFAPGPQIPLHGPVCQHYIVTPVVLWTVTNVSEGHIPPIFRIEEGLGTCN
jgi:hypothetical protein